MTTVIYRAGSAEALGLPLAIAASDAEKNGAEHLQVLITPGTYTLRQLSLEPFGDPGALSITVETDGAGVVTLQGTQVRLTGRNVTLRGVVIAGTRTDDATLRLRAVDELVVERVSVIESSSGADDLDAPIVSLQSTIRDHARARLTDVWLVGNRADHGPVLAIPSNGRGRFAHIELDRVVFAGNRASSAIETVMTAKLEAHHLLAVEPHLTGPWLDVGSFAELKLRDALVATRNGLVSYRGDAETKVDEFPKLVVERVELRGPGKQERIDARECTYAAPPAVTIDLAWALDAARAGRPPDIAALRLALD